MIFLLLVTAISETVANENGLARLPPMGWRSWNLYGANVNQNLIEGIMDGMVAKRRQVDGILTSLCDLGYCDVGLDDNWQDCKAGSAGNHYHDANGNPVVNNARFPNMTAMTEHAHKLGLTAGWYGNNCICSDHHSSGRKFYEGDVKALRKFNFDSWKLDGCGVQTDMQLWDDIMKSDGGKPIMVENCHWGSRVPYEPNSTWCPWNFYRTSGDVRASFSSVIGNLQSVHKFSSRNLSYPGCWAYPDMLEVGCQHGPGGKGDPGLNLAEARTHFGAWVIVSSPLTLSHDVNNDKVSDMIWPIISNKEAIAISQTWAGFSGGPFKVSEDTIVLSDIHHAKVEKSMTDDEIKALGPHVAPKWQYLYKPLSYDGTDVAVLMINADRKEQQLELEFKDIPGLSKALSYSVRNVWNHADEGEATKVSYKVESHDSVFLRLSVHDEGILEYV